LDAISLLNEYGMPSFLYSISFLKGFFSLPIVTALILILLSSIIVRRYQRYKAFTALLLAVLIIAVPFIHNKIAESLAAKVKNKSSQQSKILSPSKYLEAFYNTESERMIRFHAPDTESVPFDIVILQISSLSWDDLREIGVTQQYPFFKQFDYLFTDFNSVANNVSSSVIRLLQSNCGQRSDSEININELPNNVCLLFESLSSIGYKSYVGMDHDGSYGDFAKIIKKNGLNNAEMIKFENAAASAAFIDGKAPLYSDYASLKKWFNSRQASSSERAVLYYNSMFPSSQRDDNKPLALIDIHAQYKDLFLALTKDLQQFIDLIKTSKRNTVLIIVPEYGRCLIVNSSQDASLKDMPLPKITNVPVCVKLIGPKFNDANIAQQIISKPTSYFAISWVLSKFIENSPFGKTPETSDDIAFKIPKTDFVSYQSGTVITKIYDNYLYQGQDKKWITLTSEQLK
jgi:cellulose synthase operon protein YhjU